MPSYGSNPQDLGPRDCIICGSKFQPYRDSQQTCSRPCREKAKREGRSETEAYWAVWREFECQLCGARFQKSYSGGAKPRWCDSCRVIGRQASQQRKNEARKGSSRVRDYSKLYNIKRYGLSQDEYDAMFEAQGGVCAICGQPAKPTNGPSTKRLHIDHDHEAGVVRALLCASCNRGLGYFFDSYELLLKAAAYLERFKHGTS